MKHDNGKIRKAKGYSHAREGLDWCDCFITTAYFIETLKYYDGFSKNVFWCKEYCYAWVSKCG